MEYWVLFWIGVVITICTTIAIRTYFGSLYADSFFDYEKIRDENPIIVWLLAILSMICICLVGGILVAKWLGNFACGEEPMSIGGYIIAAFIPALFTYICGFIIMGLKYFEKFSIRIMFIIVFIGSIIGWTIPITNYNRNIETYSETVKISEESRQLLYFCNIPVQNISGKISGSSFIGTGDISGNISTASELSYWYETSDGTGKYDSVPASSSQIVFIEENESPFVKICNWHNQTVTINHNNETESVKVNSSWREYLFYLPKEIMQYNLD